MSGNLTVSEVRLLWNHTRDLSPAGSDLIYLGSENLQFWQVRQNSSRSAFAKAVCFRPRWMTQERLGSREESSAWLPKDNDQSVSDNPGPRRTVTFHLSCVFCGHPVGGLSPLMDCAGIPAAAPDLWPLVPSATALADLIKSGRWMLRVKEDHIFPVFHKSHKIMKTVYNNLIH